MRRIFVFTIIVLCFGSWAVHAQDARQMYANVLVNGSFSEPAQEKGDGHTHGFPSGTSALTGWDVSGGGIDVLGPPGANRRVNLGAATNISQKVNLKSGVKYELSFYVSCAGTGRDVRTGGVRVAGQNYSFSFKTPRNAGDSLRTFWRCEFAGTGPTTLEIYSTSGEEHGPFISAVLLATVESQKGGGGGSAQAVGTVVNIEGDVITLEVVVQVSGKPFKLPTKYYLQKTTRFAGNWKPALGARANVVFKLGADSRRMVEEIGPEK